MNKFSKTLEWIPTSERMPEIPKGKYGITVLVVEFDHVYEEIEPGSGQEVVSKMYARYHDRDDVPINDSFAKAKIGECGFIETLYGPKGIEWGHCVNNITHWMYMPEPPELEK